MATWVATTSILGLTMAASRAIPSVQLGASWAKVSGFIVSLTSVSRSGCVNRANRTSVSRASVSRARASRASVSRTSVNWDSVSRARASRASVSRACGERQHRSFGSRGSNNLSPWDLLHCSGCCLVSGGNSSDRSDTNSVGSDASWGQQHHPFAR
jgi:hypothetical protein